MKIFITMVSITILFIVLVFLGMPEIIKRQTADVYSKVRDMETQIRILEDFKKEQEKGWKISGLKSNADMHKVIKVMQGLALKASDIENDLGESISLAEDFRERQNDTMSELNQKLAAIERKIYLNSIMVNITTHVIGAKIELASKNIGNIRAELQDISEKLQKAKSYAEVEQKKLFDDLTILVENINTEVSVSLPAANSMINLLWYDLDKVSTILQ